ncbi:ParB/RepB/Spo0J family partition protein [Erysipelothrix rhusiopathiae]|uniref:ParB/RepB/Spo0J family partition protein n=1 Tax=Erysipelothrix rhusiopathiae TaxID=1648 RepID=UPI003BF53FAE
MSTVLQEMLNEQTKEMQVSRIKQIEIEDIERNPLNTAPMNYIDDLEALIKVNGIIEPIVVYKVANNQYRLISGERRFTIAKRLGYEMVPSIIIDKPSDEVDERLLIALHNVKRPDDIDTMREKINKLKEISDMKRERNDEDIYNVRTTEWISNQLGGLSPRTVQEYLTGKYSNKLENGLRKLDEGSEEKDISKTVKKITKKLSKIYDEVSDNMEEFDSEQISSIKSWINDLSALVK